MEILCPFKYSDRFTYCDCPYPKKEINLFEESFKSLKELWINHLIELSNCDINKANEKVDDEVHKI